MNVLPAANRQYYPALDGLRGLAILLVVVYHNFGFINYFFFGWLGVDLFFVLSGFLITDILLTSLGQKDYLKKFYLRRALRIFPLYYVCLLLFLFIIPAVNKNFDIHYYQDHQIWLWTFLQNWLYIFNHSVATNTLDHLWSLAVEEQFYLVWPFIILLLKKPKILLFFISGVLITVLFLRLWIWNNQIADLAYYNLYTFSRIDGICIGCMIALLQRIKKDFLKNYTPWILLFFAALNFLFFYVNRQYDFSFPYLALIGYTTFAMIFGLLINEVVTGGTTIITKLFSFSPLRFFGKISYGFYIFHWPVYMLITPWITRLLSPLLNGHALNFSTSLLATIAAIIISWLSFRYFESYFLKLKDRFA
jgi:peptidoglycan/LPS O-acetylase OafA/YrhL